MKILQCPEELLSYYETVHRLCGDDPDVSRIAISSCNPKAYVQYKGYHIHNHRETGIYIREVRKPILDSDVFYGSGKADYNGVIQDVLYTIDQL